MSLLEPGSFAVVKIAALDIGDQFVILFGNPQGSESHGWTWKSSHLMDEGEIVDQLAQWGFSSAWIVHCLRAARDGWRAVGERAADDSI